ncbi:hypothetical protein DJ531_07345 [Sulfolobus sp. A20-N-F6]|uniref:hypothetical protein n=1 Tax=Sulfolobaceae TaxID=118883 RepID=UPI0009F4D93F|nr:MULTISPECIES: hypothetical protein [unclassified Sulfolobus]TRM74232.1 hypothetical protein DJ523_05370 [Sulfolobus sp. E5]TRM78091.1 hypothetical protein DJ532_02445 [Sulfolobus sp. A20-N-F8]TRM78799.1 hypothetical protein DJ528_04145 [Sulfolobus sp. B5]TRM82480.1 hypothetical protein DJ524_00305 [Sulfolobus sp. D5]TRM83025.1 hypothetical protein DJ531_07345 [Sulfolobus sp. A20-N-F6]TRM86895.1 hypothetical protein DJ529_10075 [Sulfolobus sp. C3]TRM94770.1 hypothetical protein DJ526_01705
MILTSDYATFHSLPSLPLRLIPNLLRKNKYPPYGLRKIESLTNSRIVPPNSLRVKNGEIIGIYVNDPLGMSEVTRGLTEVFGEPPYFVESFKELGDRIMRLKRKLELKVIVGGPGSWELTIDVPDWIDTVLVGEAEITLPRLLKERDFPKVVYGEESDKFFPIRGPSALAEVEISRKERKIPLEVFKKEMEIQSKYHGKVNLISKDLFSYKPEEELFSLLKLASSYGKVYFSQITVESVPEVRLERVREILGLNENNWRSPVLSTRKEACSLKGIDEDVMKELNNNFIYPVVYVEDEMVDELSKYKSIIIPLPKSKAYYNALYESWIHNSKDVMRINGSLSRIVEYVLYKNKETKGEYLKRLRLRGINIFNLFVIALSSLIFFKG